MFGFGKKEKEEIEKKIIEPLHSEEYEQILKKMITQSSELNLILKKIESMETQVKSLRQRVNKHMFNETEEGEKTEESSSFLNPFS